MDKQDSQDIYLFFYPDHPEYPCKNALTITHITIKIPC